MKSRKTRREDVFARYGGEEFALAAARGRREGRGAMAEKARKLVEKHTFSFDGERSSR